MIPEKIWISFVENIDNRENRPKQSRTKTSRTTDPVEVMDVVALLNRKDSLVELAGSNIELLEEKRSLQNAISKLQQELIFQKNRLQRKEALIQNVHSLFDTKVIEIADSSIDEDN